jgi:hypothetical protein
MATKGTKRTTKKVKNLPAKRLTTRRAKDVKGGALTIKQKVSE